jgi:hypothetical protein
MVSFTRVLQGVSPTTIAATDILQFAGVDGFNSPVFVDAYQDTTHVKTSVGADKSSGNTPNNVKFISQAGGTGGDSQADWGDGTEDLDQITNAEATLKITVSNASNITTSDAVFFSYDPGQTIVNPLVGIDVRAAEVGDANFTECEGSGSALSLADQDTPATSHDFYIVISKSPTSNGLKTDKLRFETVVV